jgi:hypothetical protein
MPLDSSTLPPAGGRIRSLEAERKRSRSPLRRFLYENGLVLVAFALFLVSFAGQFATGLVTFNDDQRAHGQPTVSAVEYLGEGHFIEVTFENWESEFLQMAVFVVATALLRQKGSPESKGLDGPEPVDADPRHAEWRRDLPWPVRRGGLVLKVYEHSLSLALGLLFLLSFTMHAVGGAKEYNAEQLEHGEPTVSIARYLGSARFWFESFQNWQSEFLSVGVLVLLTVWLRERGSSQSKPVATPHDQTGEE